MCKIVATAMVSAIAALSSTPTQAAVITESVPGASARFASFLQEHGRTYQAGSAEYAMRYAHFQERLAKVEAHNSQAERTWTAVVNHLADQTPEELAMLRGYRRSARSSGGGRSSMALGLLGTSMHSVNVSHLPSAFSWGGQLKATKLENVRDQGGCGSCWAISSAAVLRAHAELYQQDRTFSTQQIVECTPNPQECGGQGGCKGATAELAMEYAATQGLLTEEEHKYEAADRKCPSELQVPSETATKHDSFLSIAVHKEKKQGGLKFGMSGWEKLPENMAEPLLLALYDKGPVVVSVAATDAWSMYSKGVMSACQKGAVINHAVVMIGYGPEFWQIQNSWGAHWGEGGTIRMLRHENKDENQYCGWDTNPSDGTGCKGGPEKVWVCRRPTPSQGHTFSGPPIRQMALVARVALRRCGSAAAAVSCTIRSCQSSPSARQASFQSISAPPTASSRRSVLLRRCESQLASATALVVSA